MATSPTERQRELGSFYTKGNPFVYEPFATWFAQIPVGSTIAEPFAGTGQICHLVAEAGFVTTWKLFDVDETLTGVEHRDSIADYPQEYDVTVTNPPYLSQHFAKRKGLDIDKSVFRGYSSLYLACIELALAANDYVAMIIPESFITSGKFRARLQAVISLPIQMFDDTDMPTCLALWGKEPQSDFDIWRENLLLGTYSNLSRGLAPMPCENRITFNVVSGQVGLKAIDSSTGATIAFCEPAQIPAEKIKVSARLVSRIRIEGLADVHVSKFIAEANTILNKLREDTEDVLLTAFKGTRNDGRFRRRLDFANARRILSHALCLVEGHSHDV